MDVGGKRVRGRQYPWGVVEGMGEKQYLDDNISSPWKNMTRNTKEEDY